MSTISIARLPAVPMNRVAIVGGTACAAVIAGLLGGAGTVIDVLDHPVACGGSPRDERAARAAGGGCGEAAGAESHPEKHYGTRTPHRFAF